MLINNKFDFEKIRKIKKQTFREITLDYDIAFSDVRKYVPFKRVKEFCRDYKASLFVRRSSNGNSHLKIVLNDRMVFDAFDMLCFRGFFNDDKYRLLIDFIRISRGETFMRLFDVKITKRGIKHAGVWLKVV